MSSSGTTPNTALELWEQVHGVLSAESRQRFLERSALEYLRTVDPLRVAAAIRTSSLINDFVPLALSNQLEALHEKVSELTEDAEFWKRLDQIKREFPRHMTNWSEADTNNLEILARYGVSVDDMATVLGRTPQSIDARLKKPPRSTPEPKARPKPAPETRHQPSTPPTRANPATRPTDESSSTPTPTSKARDPMTGIGHKGSGFSGKPRAMPSQADDREPCSGCGVLISASAAALHECRF